jgi:hypothetical protein
MWGDDTYYYRYLCPRVTVKVVMFNVAFNNILVILWHSVLLVEATEVPGEYNRSVASR